MWVRGVSEGLRGRRGLRAAEVAVGDLGHGTWHEQDGQLLPAGKGTEGDSVEPPVSARRALGSRLQSDEV